MPAYSEEIEAALEEGVALETLVAPVEVLAENGKVAGVRFISNRLSEPDSSGRRQPVPIPGTEHAVELDTVIVAISEQPELDSLDGLETTRGGVLRVNPESYLTSRPGVFAGGDVVTGPNTVINAIAAGKNAALMMNNYLTGKLLKSLTKVKLPSVYIEPVQIPDEYGETASRVTLQLAPAEQRRRTFEEVELCISEAGARGEASRCLRCDLDFTQPG
jgi:pyruvate/2-oxoglutarate dehydrogenase complex dihydrolipoamide dehydrogenase (E3) component